MEKDRDAEGSKHGREIRRSGAMKISSLARPPRTLNDKDF